MLKTLNASAADSWCGCLQTADTAVAWVTIYRDNAGADSALSYLGYNTAVFCTLCSSQATALLGDIMQSGHDYYIDIFNFRHQIFFCARCWLIVIHDWADEQTWDQLLGVSSLAAITQPDTHLTHILHTLTHTHTQLGKMRHTARRRLAKVLAKVSAEMLISGGGTVGMWAKPIVLTTHGSSLRYHQSIHPHCSTALLLHFTALSLWTEQNWVTKL